MGLWNFISSMLYLDEYTFGSGAFHGGSNNIMKRGVSVDRFVLIITFITLITSPFYSQVLSRYPYLSMPNSSEVIIAFKSRGVYPSKVMLISSIGDTLKFESDSPDSVHVFHFRNLLPGVKYQYIVSVGDSMFADSDFCFRVPKETDSSFAFLVFGDTGTGSEEQLKVRNAMINYINQNGVDFILHTGDVVYPNGEPWLYDSRYFNVYRDIIKKVFVFLTPGNHDYYYDGRGTGYFSNFYLPSNNWDGTEEYYSFTWGNAFIISLNITGFVSYTPESKQYKWLIKELSSEEAQRKTWRIVFFHIPPFSTTRFYDPEVIRFLFPIFNKYRVQIVFCGTCSWL